MFKDDDECGMCLELLSKVEKVTRTVPCGHYFCSACLEAWMKIDPTCPLDREKIKSTDRVVTCKDCKKPILESDIEHAQTHFGDWSDFRPWDEDYPAPLLVKRDEPTFPVFESEAEKISWHFKQTTTIRSMGGKCRESMIYDLWIHNPYDTGISLIKYNDKTLGKDLITEYSKCTGLSEDSLVFDIDVKGGSKTLDPNRPLKHR